MLKLALVVMSLITGLIAWVAMVNFFEKKYERSHGKLEEYTIVRLFIVLVLLAMCMTPTGIVVYFM